MRFHSITCVGPFVLQGGSVLPSAGTEGRLFYKTDENSIYQDDGSSWSKLLDATNFSGAAGDITYDNSSSGLTASNVQDAIDELVSESDTLPSAIGIGGAAGATGVPTLRRCTINSSTGVITTGNGQDVMVNSANDTSPDQQLKALKLWNAVYNDFADFQLLSENEKIIYGKCYFQTKDGLKLCNQRMQNGVVGVASNTFGISVGSGSDNLIPISISGWVLAYLDKEYESGTPLTNDENGNLTLMTREEVNSYPERLIGIYCKPETKLYFGKFNEIDVNGRHWIKVK